MGCESFVPIWFCKKRRGGISAEIVLEVQEFGMTLGASWITFSGFFKLGETIYRTEDHRREKAGGVVTSFNTVR